MKKPLIILLLFIGTIKVSAQTEPFSQRTVLTGLNNAWEIVYGPNDSLWVTENSAYKVSRISLNTTPGTKVQLLDLIADGSKTFPGTNAQPQGGLMGLAIHPDLYSTSAAVRHAKPWVYIAYVYARDPANTTCPNPGPQCLFSTRIVRYNYHGTTLDGAVIIADGLPGSSDHNSGRLVISPTQESDGVVGHTPQYRLYYTLGDMGAGQLTNTSRTENAQVKDAYEGKVLRFNTEIDGDAGTDAWAPNDNPFYDGAPISAIDFVFSMGHRNPQGLAWGNVNGVDRLYSSEQMDKADDEINIIASGNNYGWDRVSGFADDDVNGFQIGQTMVGDESNNNLALANHTLPIFTFFHHNTTWSSYPTGTTNSLWPTSALSSIAFYGSYKIPGWQNSILVTPLKENLIYRLKLNSTGTAITADTISYFRNKGNRNRRIIVGPTGTKFYVARDAGASANGGAIIEYTYTGTLGTLPLKLLTFKGALQNNSAVLEWSTAEESNTDKFIIERSLDGSNYSEVGTVDAAGNSNGEQSYSFKDDNAAQQQTTLLYYRLKMVDRDTKFSYSNIITIALNVIAGKITVSPNPVHTAAKLNIYAGAAGKVQVRISDNTGRMIISGTTRLIQGINQVDLDFSTLKAGIYFLNVTGTGFDQQLKIQKL